MENCTIVTVHLRMGDYDNHLRKLGWGPNILTKTNYVPEAFKYVIRKYEVRTEILFSAMLARLQKHFVMQNPKFLVLGEDKEDLLEYLDTEEMKFAENITTVPATTRDNLFSDTYIYKGKSKHKMLGLHFALNICTSCYQVIL